VGKPPRNHHIWYEIDAFPVFDHLQSTTFAAGRPEPAPNDIDRLNSCAMV
jgi:hypothetical protein